MYSCQCLWCIALLWQYLGLLRHRGFWQAQIASLRVTSLYPMILFTLASGGFAILEVSAAMPCCSPCLCFFCHKQGGRRQAAKPKRSVYVTVLSAINASGGTCHAQVPLNTTAQHQAQLMLTQQRLDSKGTRTEAPDCLRKGLGRCLLRRQPLAVAILVQRWP